MAGTHLSPTEVALEGQRIGPLQLRVAAICLLAQTFDGYDLSSISMAAPALSQAWRLPGTAFANTFVMSSVGIMVGALLSGPVGDRLGRKPVLLASLLLLVVSSFACVHATTIPALSALRFVTGLGIGTLMPATVALTSDYLPSRHRASVIMVVFTGAPLGGFLGGQLVAQLLPAFGWTVIFSIGWILPAALLPVVLLWLPESPRFLLRTGNLTPRTQQLLRQLNIDTGRSADPQASHGLDLATGNPVAGLFRDGLAPVTVLVWTLYFANLISMYLIGYWMPTVLHMSGLSPAEFSVRSQSARRRTVAEYFRSGPAQPALYATRDAGMQPDRRHPRDRRGRFAGSALPPVAGDNLPDRLLHDRQHDGHQRHDRGALPGACPQHRNGLGAGCRASGRHWRAVVRRPVAGPGLAAAADLSVRLRHRRDRRRLRVAVALTGPPGGVAINPPASLDGVTLGRKIKSQQSRGVDTASSPRHAAPPPPRRGTLRTHPPAAPRNHSSSADGRPARKRGTRPPASRRPPAAPRNPSAWRSTTWRIATPSERGSRASPSSAAQPRGRRPGCSRQGGRRNTAQPPSRPGIDTHAVHQQVQVGVVGQRHPGRGPARSSSRRQIASTSGPPVSTGAQDGFGGRPHPALALRNSQRLPSSR